MKVVNLEKISKIKRGNIVRDYCGGHYGSKEAFSIGGVGVGGLHYINGADIVDNVKKGTSLRANVESLKEGFGFYLRENEGNYLLLIRYDDILNVSFYKEMDRLNRKEGFSLFQACLNRGIPYHYSKLMLMEDEIKEVHKPKVKIITKDLDEINFVCSRKNPLKIKNYFENLALEDKYDEDYLTYSY
ncbi:MAG: hypothetical protein P1U56_24405 [Saprospiraceae bacterium]|nr:hypothetical protein [Saprospiraceae bacterium]